MLISYHIIFVSINHYELPLFGKYKETLARMIPLVFGILVLWVSKSVEKISGPLWMVPLGIHPHGFYTLDYEPLFPWFGVILIGIAVGVGLHPKGKRDVSLSFLGKNVPPVLKFFSFLGRHSLIVYLGYQLVILGGLVLIIGV